MSTVGNSLNKLGKLTIDDLMKFNGVGEAKAITVITALELGRRRRQEDAISLSIITSSKEVFEMMQPIVGELQYEEFWVLYLNNSNKVLYKEQLSKGGLTGTVVDVRLVFKKSIALYATSIILVHNHPSGKLNPSMADKSLTHKIKLAGETLDIKVLDHLIITENDYFSFADEQLL